VSHTTTLKPLLQTSKQKLEAGTDDARLCRMPLVKAGLRQLKSM